MWLVLFTGWAACRPEIPFKVFVSEGAAACPPPPLHCEKVSWSPLLLSLLKIEVKLEPNSSGLINP